MDLIDLFVLSLAAWRLSSLIMREHGPLAIFDKLRHMAGVRYDEHSQVYGTNNLSRGMLCAWCSSVWFGIILAAAYYLIGSIAVWVVLPLAISAMAIIVESYVGGQI